MGVLSEHSLFPMTITREQLLRDGRKDTCADDGRQDAGIRYYKPGGVNGLLPQRS